MSNALAMATVTACIRNLLEHALRNDSVDPMSGAEVKILSPGSQNLPTQGALLFLARVTPSASWRSFDLPTRGPNGGLIDRPQVGLTLHFLLAMRGDEQAYEPHRIAGIISRVLATKPVLSRDVVTETIAAQPSLLGKSDLAESLESVRITPEAMTTEELSKIWTAYPQASQGPWLAYEATTVVLDADFAVGPSLPVLDRNIRVSALTPALITGVAPSTVPGGITAGSEIVINGRNLAAGDTVQAFFDGEDSGVVPGNATSTMVRLLLPSTLAAGMHGVRVAAMTSVGAPLRRSSESNFFAFELAPSITAPITLTEQVAEVVDGITLCSGNLSVTCSPAIGREQKVELLLNGMAMAGRPGRAYAFRAPNRSASTPSPTIAIPVRDVPSGTYVARIRVDGASSALQGGGDTPFNAPTVVF